MNLTYLKQIFTTDPQMSKKRLEVWDGDGRGGAHPDSTNRTGSAPLRRFMFGQTKSPFEIPSCSEEGLKTRKYSGNIQQPLLRLHTKNERQKTKKP